MAGPAEADAIDYATYILMTSRSPESARKWLDGLYDEIKSLAKMPNRFPIIPESDELGSEYRSLLYHSHRVIYAVQEADSLVIVLRVYHSARLSLTRRDLNYSLHRPARISSIA
ncbi:MAG: type II toxin-antitoxin system RelE/ParE family toxin [Armatimonadetes bacterium]|nr:type II toxin-antitoxin system RelE/ParE family toxin [Armatimonadota bacterium]